jgi:hypothetical protein
LETFLCNNNNNNNNNKNHAAELKQDNVIVKSVFTLHESRRPAS